MKSPPATLAFLRTAPPVVHFITDAGAAVC